MKKIATFAYPAIVALSLLASVAAHAAGEQTEAPAAASTAAANSQRTRAEVRAEAVAANRAGYAHFNYGAESNVYAVQRALVVDPAPMLAKAKQAK